MPLPAIPAEDTLLFSELTALSDGRISTTNSTSSLEYLNEEFYPALHDEDLIPIEREGGFTDNDKEIEYLVDNYKVKVAQLRQAVLSGMSTIRIWTPNTIFNGPISDNLGRLVRAPDVVYHLGNLYLVTEGFISEISFGRKVLGITVLERLTMDKDPVYLEITANIKAPILVGDEVGSYASNRQMIINKTYTFPDSELANSDPNVEHVAYCNPEITTPCIVDIKRLEDAALVTIGQITFTPMATTHRLQGVFTFNDSVMGPESATKLYLGKGDVLIFEMNTVDLDLEWVRINMVAEAVNFTSEYFDPVV